MTLIRLQVPNYAQSMLWLTDAQGFTLQLENQPEVDLSGKTLPLFLRWGHPSGSALTQWDTMPHEIRWSGEVQITGHVDCTHLLTAFDLDLMVIEIKGYVKQQPDIRFPTLAQLKQAPFERNYFRETDNQAPMWYSFLLPMDSPLSDFAHHSAVNGSAIDAYGRLADEQEDIPFQQLIGMPILLESMTLYS